MLTINQIINRAFENLHKQQERVMPIKQDVSGFKINKTQNGFTARNIVQTSPRDHYEVEENYSFESFGALTRHMAEQLGINTISGNDKACGVEKSPAQIDEIVRLRAETQRWQKLHDGMPIELAERAKSLAMSVVERLEREQEKEIERRRESRRKAASTPKKASPPRKR